MAKPRIAAGLLASAMLVSVATPALAAEPAPKAQVLTLKRVFGSPDLSGPQPQSLKLSPDGTLLTSLRPRADEKQRFDLWALDTKTGQERMLVDSKKVGSGAELSEAEKMQRERDRSISGKTGIVSYEWSPDGKTILVPIDGDLYLAGLDGKVTRLTENVGGALNPKISPAGGYVSYVRDQNLVAQPLGGRPRALTDDGKGTVHWGEAEFVAQEEMDRRTGYWWAPGDARVAVERFDEAPVGIITRAAIGANGTKTYDQRYPAAGTPNVLVGLYVMKPDGSGRVKVDLGKETDIYLARVDWAPNGSALYVQRQNRAQTVLDMLKVDPATGKSTILFSEKARADSWVNLSDAYRFLDDGSLIWNSERDGFSHLYRFNAGNWTQLTKGDWVIMDLVGVDQAKGRIFFTGNKDGVLEKHLYSVDLARPGGRAPAPVRLTEPGWWNGASMDKSASRIIVSRSNPDQPTQMYLADATGKRLSWINQNALVAGHPYFPFVAQHQATKFGTMKAADGSTLHWEMITPPLVAGKTYPVFFEHYGGPHVQTVSRNWGGALHQYIASKGYIVFMIDNRGSANRGVAFESQLYRAAGSVEVADQLLAAKWLKKQPFVAPDKIVTYGWSYGGYMTLKMLEAAPGVFAAGVAGAPVTKWELYDTHYTERYMGDPKKDSKAYAASSALTDAPKIADPMLLIHGMSDDNVFFENSTALAARMQAASTPFEMMFYPGFTHRVGGPQVGEHLWTTILNFYGQHLGK